MRRWALSGQSAHASRRVRAPMIVLFTLLTLAILCAVAVVPAAALAAVADTFEPDDSYAVAKPITVDAAAQQHTIFPEGEEDWVSFSVEAGWSYAIETAAGTPLEDVDTFLYLYDSDGTSEIAHNDDHTGYYSRIDYTADESKTLYVRVRAYDSGDIGAYALSVTRVTLVWDSYEPDASAGAASPITVNATAQQHTISPQGDEDWVSFSVEADWKYAIETAPGVPPEDPDTRLYLYDSSGMILIDSNDDHAGTYSRIDYTAEADGVMYAMVRGYDTGTYALSVTRTPVIRIGVVPATIDFGEVAEGDSVQRTVVVENQGVAPLDVGAVELTGAGFSVVRDEAGGATIPVGESREIEVAYTPSEGVVYTGPPAAVQHDWTNIVATYNYSGGVLVSVSLYTGFQNLGGAGDVGWRVRIGAVDWTGTGPVVPGGRYTMRVNVSAGSGSVVQVLEPIGDTFSNAWTGSSVLSVAYLRVPDAFLSIESNDDDEPTTDVGLFGYGVPAPADSTPPTTSDDYDGQWHNTAVTVHLSAADNAGGSGMSGGLARTEYSRDGGATWVEGTAVSYGVSKRGGGSGLHELLYRSTDAAGNLEETQSCEVKIDARAPLTSDDAPSTPQSGAVTVHLAAADSLFGVSACSGLAATWYRLDNGGWTQGSSVPVSGTGTHWICYYSTDNAGNAEYAKWCSVTISP